MKIHYPKSIFLTLVISGLLINPITNGPVFAHSNGQDIQIPNTGLYSSFNENLTPHQIETQEECKFQLQELSRGAAKDAIQSIDNPTFVTPDHSTAPEDPRQKVLGVVFDGIARAYPYNILNWHEIVNDDFNGNQVSITYCPLTGSGILYPTSELNDTELGVSGLLFENNLVFFERDTDKHWSQMGGFVVKGAQLGGNLDYVETVETTWETWQKLYPNTTVLSSRTQVPAPYDRYPYGPYRTDRSIFFPTTYNDQIEPYNLYHEKELTHVIQFGDETLLLPFQELSKIQLLNHEFTKQDLLTIFLEDEELAITYSAVVNNIKLEFSLYEDIENIFSSSITLDLPLFIDNLENIWNINGLAISGPLLGTQLNIVPTYNAFWFAAISFFYGASILIVDDTDTSTSVILSSFSVTPEVQDQDSLSISNYYALGFITLSIVRYKKKSKVKI